jgi:hypothetical protein
MRNFKQVKDGIINFLEGNDMVETVMMSKKQEDAFNYDVDLRSVVFAPVEFEIGKTDWSLKFAFIINTKAPLDDEDAYITAQEENVLITAQLNDFMEQNDVDAFITEAAFALPDDKEDSQIVTASFVLEVRFQRVQYVNFDE